MRILLANDDGIHAEGIHVLKRVAGDFGEALAVAPDGERSACSHAITLTRALRARPWPSKENPFGFAVDGMPVDCVKLGVSGAFGPPPELVLSGINLGPNAGISVLYSGTVGVASEGAISGIPAIAFSLATFENPLWETAEAVARTVLAAYAAGNLAVPAGTFLNVNIPNLPLGELKGFAATRMGASRFVETYERRLDPWGNPYFWMSGELVSLGDDAGTDLGALRNGFVSVSPIGLDLTVAAEGDALARALAALPPLA
jgi:5'-nucleotidase